MKEPLFIYRLIFIGLIVLFCPNWSIGQTDLSPGDIAITGVNMDNPDEISLVFLVDIEIGTIIKFTDNGWKSDNTWRGGEGTHTWTASITYLAGEEIFIELDGPTLATLGDQVIAYQNTSDFVSAINDEGSSIWQNDAISSNTSALPQGLTNGKNCIALTETDNIIYNRSLTTGTKAEILTAINNYENWTGSNTVRQSLSTSGFSITSSTSNTWTGNGDTDTNWSTAENWTNGVPSSNHNVTIPNGITNNPIISTTTSANCYDLTLEGDATLNIISDATNSGSLIIEGNYSGSSTAVTYQRYMLGDAVTNKWHLLGSPLIGQGINASFLSANSISGMKDYIESPEAWNTDYTVSDPNTNFSIGKGYAVKRSSNGIISLSGTPNNASVNTVLTRGDGGNGWNLLSNPFTSAIATNISGDASNNLLSINTDVLDDNYDALYLWDETSTSYKIINHAGGTPEVTLEQNYLQVGQGFFVKSIIGGGSFSMTPAMQSHQTGIPFKSEENSWASIILKAETSTAEASAQISFREDMSRALDIGYDAGILKNGSLILYSRLIEDNGVDFGIQCLPADYEALVIPIGLEAKAGDIIAFSAIEQNLPEEYAVVLEDRMTGLFTNLSDEEAKYNSQVTNDSEGTGRFYLHTLLQSALSMDDLNRQRTFQLFINKNCNQVIIHGEMLANSTAKIYSIAGKLMTAIALDQETENRIPFDGNSGIYILQITNKKAVFTQKFIWLK